MTVGELTSFQPPWWLKNCHLQSCVGAFVSSKFQDRLAWEQLDLPDGDFIDLCWAGQPGNPTVVLLHGLEGSIHSHYIQLMMKSLTEEGWHVVLMHFRTCSGRINRLARNYHASDTKDFEYLLELLQQRYPQQSIQAVGFSLGANVLLHYLARIKNSPIRSAVAVSTPFELTKSVDYVPKLYRWVLLRTMKYKAIQKILAGQEIPVSINAVKRISDFYTFDNLITAPLNGFKDATEYYERSSIRPLLKFINYPTLMIHAEDDPFVPINSIPHRVELSDSILFDLHKCGGHIGFIHGEYPWRISRWFKARILEFLKKTL